MTISIADNVDEIISKMTALDRQQIPYALSRALNDTAKEVVEAEQRHMGLVFDRPTRWTLNAFFVRRSSKKNLRASVERKTTVEQRFYLEVQQQGGVRRNTGMESALRSRLTHAGSLTAVTPAGIRKTAAGNVSRAAMTKIMKEARPGTQSDLFVPKPGSGLSPGVYKRMKRRKVKKLLHFTTAMPSYVPRFDFHGVADREARAKFEHHFGEWLRRAMATAK